jgi:TM2 domain-containing membrane protein YozV
LYCEKCGRAVSAAQAAAAGASLTAASFPQPPQTQPFPPQAIYQAAPYMDPRVRASPATAANAQYAVGKSPFLALFLSFLLPGVGQFYNGDTKRGLPMFLVGIFSFAILIIPVVGWIIAIGIHIWSMINAYNVATRKTALG